MARTERSGVTVLRNSPWPGLHGQGSERCREGAHLEEGLETFNQLPSALLLMNSLAMGSGRTVRRM
jgi:hypothetical protein